MKIEVIEFYPLESNENNGFFSGTIRVKLPDSGIHILGIYVCKRKDSWFFNLPGKTSTHHETGEEIRYPFICFEDREKHRELIEEIREKGRAFIEKRLADTEKPIIFPQKKQQQKQTIEAQKLNGHAQPASEGQKGEKTDPIAKKTPSTGQTSSIKKIVEWKDPPPRKQIAKKQYSTTTRR